MSLGWLEGENGLLRGTFLRSSVSIHFSVFSVAGNWLGCSEWRVHVIGVVGRGEWLTKEEFRVCTCHAMDCEDKQFVQGGEAK